MQLGWFWNELSKIAADFAQYKHAEPGRRSEPENENGLDLEGDAYTDKICCIILLGECNMNPSASYKNWNLFVKLQVSALKRILAK